MLTPRTNSQTYSQRAFSHVIGKQSSQSVQHQHFQLSKLPRIRCRKECSEEQEKKELWQSRSWLNLVPRAEASSCTAPSSSASSCQGTLGAPSQQRSNLIALSAGPLAAADTRQSQSVPEIARTFAAKKFDINDEDHSKWPHNLRVSCADIPHLEQVYANLRRHFKRDPEDKMDDPSLNAYVGHPASRSNQKSATRNNETIFRCNQEARLARQILEEDDSVERPSSSVVGSKSLRVF